MKTLELLPPAETMYRALVNRDPSFEGIFYIGVRTTGIFCRPTCSAKKPARENVDFFATSSDALENGYRPCLRCHPLDPNARPPKLIERLRAEVERAPDGRLTDKELAALSIDPSTARRQFKRHYGMTFQAYHRARRMGLALNQVRQGDRVDQARNGSGFESESGFRDAFTKIFGESPTNARTHAPLFAERIDSPLGPMIAVADDQGLRLLEFIDRRATESELSILRKRLCTNVVPGNIGLSKPSVRNSGTISPARSWSLKFRWLRSDPPFNCALGKSCSRFLLAKRVRIRGWQSVWAMKMRVAQLVARMART